MEFRHMQYFVEIVDSKSYTVASAKLHVTQPTLTRVVNHLEAQLGVLLLERTSKSFRLTDAGALFYTQAVEMILRYHDLYRSVDDMKSVNIGEVRLSTPGVLLELYFSKLLLAFHQTNPNININIIEEGSKLTAQSVLTSNIDLGLVMLPVAGSSQLEIHTVVIDIVKVLVAKGHPYYHRTSLPVSALADQRIITFGDTATLHDSFIKLCDAAGFSPHVAYKSLMPTFIFEMVASGSCLGVLPGPVIDRYNDGGFRAIPLEPQFPWHIAVVRKKKGYQSYASKALLDFMIQHFKTLEKNPE